jgi:hypothetical protein
LRVGFAFLAEHAIAHDDGKLYVIGGDVERFMLGGPQPAALVVRFDADREEVGRTYQLEFPLVRVPGGDRLLGEAPRMPFLVTPRVVPDDGRAPAFHMALQMLVTFPELGRFAYEVLCDGRPLASIQLEVIPRPSAAALG